MSPPPGRIETVGGFATHLLDAGAGPPVLLLHGSSVAVDAWLTWFRLIPALAPRHRVVAYDQPGFGRSAMPARYLDRLERARHAAALVDALDLRDLTVVGHSEGGFIATWLALERPERVRRLVIAASGGTAPALGGDADAAWQAAADAAYDYPRRCTDEETYVRSEADLRGRDDPELEAILRANYRCAETSGNRALFLARPPAAEPYTALQERWILPRLGTLRAPALLIWGGADATVPVARGRALAALMPRSELVVFPGAGHWVMHAATEAFNGRVAGWAPTAR